MSLALPHGRWAGPLRAFCRPLHLLAPQLPVHVQPSPSRILRRGGAGDIVGEPAGTILLDDAAAGEPAGPLLLYDAAASVPAGPRLADKSGQPVPVMPAAVDKLRLRSLIRIRRFFGGFPCDGLARGSLARVGSTSSVSAIDSASAPAVPVLNAAAVPATSDARCFCSSLTLAAVSKGGGHGTTTTGTSQPIVKLPKPET